MPEQNKNLLCSWSGGKDSCYALIQARAQGFVPKVLLNVLNEEGKISRSHGIPAAILAEQAKSANLPIHLISSSWQDYEHKFTAALTALKSEHNLEYAVFGDIDLQAHRDWEEKVCAVAGLRALLPLWQQDRYAIVMRMLEEGIQAMIVSCNETMGQKFLGKMITPSIVTELHEMGIDVCGENGEFHTLVLNCQLFSYPLSVMVKNKIKHDQYWFCELEDSGAK